MVVNVLAETFNSDEKVEVMRKMERASMASRPHLYIRIEKARRE